MEILMSETDAINRIYQEIKELSKNIGEKYDDLCDRYYLLGNRLTVVETKQNACMVEQSQARQAMRNSVWNIISRVAINLITFAAGATVAAVASGAI